MINVFTRGWVALSLTAFLGRCLPTASGPSKFYLLQSNSNAQPLAGEGKVSVGVGPVDLPQYLDRPQIVTRTAGNELTINEFNRWAEPLKDNFTRVMATNVEMLLGTDQVYVFPWGGSASVDYQVKVEVASFIGELGGESSLVARWSILGDNGRKVLLTRRSQLQASLPNSSYESLVNAMNATLTNLSQEIARAIRSLPSQ